MDDGQGEGQQTWRLLLRSQYQHSLVLEDGSIVLLDGPASVSVPQLPEFRVCGDMEKLPLGMLFGLAELVDRNKSNNSVKFDAKA
uniref:Uncharacterized protein n=1 Tax=Ditylenchus dipsaci TaxID=166011 RepID=A0A915EGD7_9BILA